jgi:hypothetical protein
MKLILPSLLLILFSNAFSQQDTAASINIVSALTKGFSGPVKFYRKNGTLKKEVYSDWNANKIFVYYRRGKYRKFKYQESEIVTSRLPSAILLKDLETIPQNHN